MSVEGWWQVLWLLLWGSCACAWSPRQPLPVYIEDNHAGTFQFLASTLDLEERHALVLIDAHPDTGIPPGIAALREGIRDVTSPEERSERVMAWRKAGALQAYDWIAPLMPRPIERVLWIRSGELPHDPEQKVRDAALRRFRTLGPRFELVSLERCWERLPPGLPVVVSIDLDSFAGLDPVEAERRFTETWGTILQFPRLCAVSFAISRPWLSGVDEAERLLRCVLRGVLSLGHARVRFEPFGLEGPDSSERAKAWRRKGEAPPRFDPRSLSRELRSLSLSCADRLEVGFEAEAWRELLEDWRLELHPWRVSVEGVDPGSDRVFRPPSAREPELRIQGGPSGAIRGVTWYKWVPARWSYNVMPELTAGKGFTGDAPPVVSYVPEVLARTLSPALECETWRRELPGPGRCGVLRLSAELRTDSGVEYTPCIELRQGIGQGFRAGLSEQFGLPYVFGAGLLERDLVRGPDVGVGNDCANFLVAAWRKSGLRLPWSSPGQLRSRLPCLARGIRAEDAFAIPPGALDRGLVVHFHSHVAAVWEDRSPVGVLDGGDLVAHHLGKAPEVITLGELVKTRGRATFDVYGTPEGKASTWIAIGGDVMPGEPPRGLRELLSGADLAVANLETTVGDPGGAGYGRYVFAISPEHLALVKTLGFQAFSLANNHVDDHGTPGLAATLAALDSLGMDHFGAGTSLQEALRPRKVQVGDVTVAFLGISGVNPDHAPGMTVATFSAGEREIAKALTEAKAGADCVIVMPHWGDEGKQDLNEMQRTWARWLVQHGADAVVGCGPHVRQAMENLEGVPVCFSTGNLWDGGRWPKGERRGVLLFLGLDDRGRIVATWEKALEGQP